MFQPFLCLIVQQPNVCRNVVQVYWKTKTKHCNCWTQKHIFPKIGVTGSTGWSGHGMEGHRRIVEQGEASLVGGTQNQCTISFGLFFYQVLRTKCKSFSMRRWNLKLRFWKYLFIDIQKGRDISEILVYNILPECWSMLSLEFLFRYDVVWWFVRCWRFACSFHFVIVAVFRQNLP